MNNIVSIDGRPLSGPPMYKFQIIIDGAMIASDPSRVKIACSKMLSIDVGAYESIASVSISVDPTPMEKPRGNNPSR